MVAQEPPGRTRQRPYPSLEWGLLCQEDQCKEQNLQQHYGSFLPQRLRRLIAHSNMQATDSDGYSSERLLMDCELVC